MNKKLNINCFSWDLNIFKQIMKKYDDISFLNELNKINSSNFLFDQSRNDNFHFTWWNY
jgi:hypothetical protein